MPAPAGFAGQIGFKSETTWNTPVTPDQFVPFVSEGIKNPPNWIPGKWIRGGRRTMGHSKRGGTTIAGPIRLPFPNIGAPTLLKHMFGEVATTGVGPHTHTASPGSLTGKSLSIQFGRPDIGGTVQPFTYTGCKFPSWELSCAVGDHLFFVPDVSAADEDTATPLAVASYAAAWEPFSFAEGSVTIDGTPVATVKQLNLRCGNTLATDRHFIRNSRSISEQLENGERTYSGAFATEFESLAAYTKVASGALSTAELLFDNGVESITITQKIRWLGETPVISGQERLDQPLPYEVVTENGDTDAAGITAVLAGSSEATAA